MQDNTSGDATLGSDLEPTTDSTPVPEALAAALQAAAQAPEQEARWEALEEVAAQFQRPDDVYALYKHVLARKLPKELVVQLGQRVVRFHDEWFEDATPLVSVLTRVFDADSGADWAFHRLSMLLTNAERWAELLAFYDRALAGTQERAKLIQLLDEAAHVAKDFAGEPDRAIQYLEQLFPLKPSDNQLATSLERLFEKQSRYEDLIKLWSARLTVLPKKDVAATRARIAACWLDHLDNPGEALTAVEALLNDGGDDKIACGLLERIVALQTSPAEVRTRAVNLLRQRYDSAQRGADVVRVLGAALAFADRAAKLSLHAEIAKRLETQQRDEEAIEHYSALVALEPGDQTARAHLRELATKTRRQDRYAAALAAAADACDQSSLRLELWVEAANTRCETLNDASGAIDLYDRVLRAPDAQPGLLLEVARRQATLLERANRSAEQLDVLERLAKLETERDTRHAVLAQAARLADSLSATDRALAAWQHRLDDDPEDLETLDAMVDLLDRAQRWEPLIAVLRRRTAAARPPEQRRADLVRIATIQTQQLSAASAGIETWTEVEATFGQNAETVDSLSSLFATMQRWKDLSKLLDGAAEAEQDPARRAELLRRLGDVYRLQLESNKKATKAYKESLEADPRNDGARTGLRALLDDEKCLPTAVETLARAYTATDEWQFMLDILEPRLLVAKNAEAKTRVLLEAAKIQEERASDPRGALGSLRRALPLSPSDQDIERELVRLAESTSGWGVAIEAYREAIAALPDDPERVAALRFEEGQVLETRLVDFASSLTAYQRVCELNPTRVDATGAVVRVAAHVDRWDAAATAIAVSAAARGTVESTFFATVEHFASERGSWDEATQQLEVAVGAAKGLDARAHREIETQIAIWHRDRRGDADAAERALLRAVAHDATDAATLRMLAELQRRAAGRPLVITLLQLAATGDEDHLDALHEAADVALRVLADAELARSTLSQLLERSAARWQVSADVLGTQTPEANASYALEQLVKVYTEAQDFATAVKLLVDGAKLPFPAEVSQSLRHQAAEISAAQLNDGAQAIDLYRGILKESPGDGRAIRQLAMLYETHERLSDLLALRRHELALGPSLERRLALRRDIARVLGTLDDRSARVEALRENLAEQPGHEASIQELSEVLSAEGNFALLADLLAEQADRLEQLGQQDRAADLWARLATVAEEKLADVPRALASHRRVVALGATHEALDALARLHVGRGEFTDAVGWLEQRLASTSAGQRAQTVVRLASAHLGAGKHESALACLEHALGEDPAAEDVRTLLANQYRERGSWEPLARLLHEGASHVGDAAVKLAYLRESAEIYHRRLGDPDTAIPIFEKAVELAPQDRTVRTALADALRAAKRLDEARTLLEGLIAEFGRRRPPERAAVHFALAQIARARGDVQEALAQLDTAASMDMQHPGIQRMLGDLARDAGQFERAEKAYRALLLVVRRQSTDSTLPDAVGASEVLFELYRLAQKQGDEDRAREILESAFETASQSESEARRIERTLRAHGDPELLLRSLTARLARNQDPDVAAVILADLAEVLTGLGRVDEALDASLKALSSTPNSAALHNETRSLARQLGAINRYADAVSSIATQAKETGDGALACDLFLRLAELTEQELGDAAKAAEIYALAESTGERVVESWRALDRLYGSLGKTTEQVRVLRQFVNADVDESVSAEQTEAMYRLTEMELANQTDQRDGIAMLSWALDREPQYDRAARILRAASRVGPPNEKLLQLYDRVARATADPAVILDSLECAATLPNVTPDLLREAVETAQRLDEHARAEALLRRTVEVAEQRGTLGESVWALVALAERSKARGDLAEGSRWLRQAVESADTTEAFQLGLELGALAAGPLNDLALAASTYEKLREKEPGDRNVWEPLLDVYRRLGDRERLAELIAKTLDSVFDSAERNQLRMERARLLLDEPNHEDEAMAVLRDILEEDPTASDAATMLIDLLESTGRGDDLSDLLRAQLDAARDRADAPAIGRLSVKLGRILEATSRNDALDTYRAALEWVPEQREVLTALLRLYGPDDDVNDRADAMERLLGLETGEAAAKLCLELVAIREAQSDDAGVERALLRGFRGCPEHSGIKDRLWQWYSQREDWAHLAEMLEVDAASRPDPAEAVRLYREAASLYRDRMESAAHAAQVLRRARALAAADLELLKECAHALCDAGENQAAADEVASALDSYDDQPAIQADLFKLRSELRTASGDHAGAVSDLEEAMRLGGDGFGRDLALGLEGLREFALSQDDTATARATVLRLVQLLGELGDARRPGELLADWVKREPSDAEALRMLARIESDAGRWDGAADAYGGLIAIETGAAQVEAALKLAEACERAGRPGDARPGLEQVQQAVPDDDRIRTHLRRLYEQVGAHRELAELSLADARNAPDEATRFQLLRKAGELWIKTSSDGEQAISALEEAMKLRPSDQETTVLLADAYTQGGKMMEATQLLDTAIHAHKGRRSKELAGLQYRMARVANAAGDRSVELAWLNVALDSDMQNGQIAAELADVAIELGQAEVALKALRAVTLMKSPGPMSRAMAFLKQGMLAKQAGDARKAAFLAKKALTEDPALSEAGAFLKELGE